ncbi:MAG TPA: Na+/H+ antiporter NhaA [Dehalococcoidia bacterium]|nr:Na+/H+ antiporter NhaA [Dehalococcoidia bacterium]
MERTASLIQPVARPPIARVLRPFQRFAQVEASGGIVLLIVTAIALVWANSPWAASYTDLWETHLAIGLPGVVALDLSLHHWINDGLMVIFFFVVGLEIKRELLVGELASVRRAALPIAAAAGGMVVPAAIYVAFNLGGPGMRGWGVPMATDIAFALGVLTLVGSRAPLGLKVFLTALAIVDDLGAVLVIALFYTADLDLLSLAAGGGIVLLLLVANRAGVRRPMPYAVLGILLWLAFLRSGVHATIAGVVLALTIPFQVRLDTTDFLTRARALLDRFEAAGDGGGSVPTNSERQEILQELETACEQAETPLQRLEHELHPWVTYAIMPIFALANAGVALDGNAAAALVGPVGFGVVAGLVLGKQVGITLAAWLAVRAGLAALPEGVTWRHVYGAAWLGGIGFTMALFIGSLAFVEPERLALAKMGIFAGSLIAGVGGYLILRSLRVAEPE